MNDLLLMSKAVLHNPIGMSDRTVVEGYWKAVSEHDLRIGLLNLALNN